MEAAINNQLEEFKMSSPNSRLQKLAAHFLPSSASSAVAEYVFNAAQVADIQPPLLSSNHH